MVFRAYLDLTEINACLDTRKVVIIHTAVRTRNSSGVTYLRSVTSSLIVSDGDEDKGVVEWSL